MDDFFSIIIPVYNRKNTIIRAVNSVLQQSYSNFELIVVDDHSDQDLSPIIDDLGDSRIKVIRNDYNLGPAGSRNVGIKFSSGQYICFLDSDDTYLPDYLREVSNTFKNCKSEIGFLWTGIITIGENNEVINSGCWRPEIYETPYKTFLKGIYIGTNCGICIRKECFDFVTFDSELRAAEDTEFFLRLSQLYDFTFIDKNLVTVYKDRKDRVTFNYSATLLAYQKIYQIHNTEISKSEFLRKKYLKKMLRISYYSSEMKYARKIYSEMNWSFDVFLLKWLFEIMPVRMAIFIHGFLARQIKRIGKSGLLF